MKPPIRGRYLAAPGDSTPSAMQLSLDGPATEPDLLVYWSETRGDSTALPPQAVLLGALNSGGVMLLPAGAPGYLIFYSLAHQTRVATAMLPPVAP